MKLKKLVVIFLFAAILISQFSGNYSYAVENQEGSYDIVLENRSQSTEIHPGDEFIVDVGIRNVRNIENGIVSISGHLEYNSNILERISINQQNGWDMTGGFNSDNLKFVIDTDKYVDYDENIFLIKFKVKENIQITDKVETEVSIKDIEASNAVKDIYTQNATLKINIIKPKEPDFIRSEKYTIEENIITKILPNTTVDDFKKNVTTNTELVFKDKAGNTLSNTDLVATGTTLKVGTTFNFTLVVRGDIDGNGRVSSTDLAQLKRHYVGLRQIEGVEEISGVRLLAADTNMDGTITITDLSQIKLIIIGLLTLK